MKEIEDLLQNDFGTVYQNVGLKPEYIDIGITKLESIVAFFQTVIVSRTRKNYQKSKSKRFKI